MRIRALMALSVTATATAMPVRYVPTLVEADDAQLHALAVAGGVVTGQWRQWTGEAWIKSVFFWNAGDLTLVPATHENCEAVLFGAGQTDVAYGFDYTDDLLMRFEADAMTPLASLGQVTSTAELVGSTQQGLIAGNLGGAGFVWSASDGVQHLSEGAWDLATIAAVNDTVGAVGTIDLHHSIDERAFQYLPAEGVMFDLHGDFKGRTRAVGVDGTNHILLIRQQNNGPVDFVLTDGAAGMIDSTIHSIGGAPINAHGVIGLNGHIATIWNQPFEPPQVGIVKDDGSVVVHDAPPGVIAAQLLGMSSLGTAWGAWLTELYQFQPFIVDQHTPPQLLNHAIIGYPELSFSGPTCLSDTGGIVWSFSGTTFQPSLYLTEAAAGDADGDGTVDTDDLLLILSAWGDWSSEDPCGPDLNLDHLVDVDDLLTLIEQWQ